MRTIDFTWHSAMARDDTLPSAPWPTVQLSVAVKDAADTQAVLERIFRCCNRVNGSPIEIVPKGFPSMSAGDLVEIDSHVYYCAPWGWRTVTDPAALAAYRMLPPRYVGRCAPAFQPGSIELIRAREESPDLPEVDRTAIRRVTEVRR